MSKSGMHTFPLLLLRNAKLHSTAPAMRHKHLGVWQSWTWAEMSEQIRDFALGLRELGFERGMRVAIIGTNRPRLYWAMASAQSLGGIPVPLYEDSVADEMAYVFGHAEVSMAIVENQEQVDKLLSIKSQLPNLKHIIYDEPRGLRDYPEPNLYHFPRIQKEGRNALKNDSQLESRWHAELAMAKKDDVSVILYTSGTTGRPKGVMLTYANLMTSAMNANAFDALNKDEEVLAYLPMAWIGDHVFSYAQAYCAGYCVCCSESGKTIEQNRREIAPTYFFAPPRAFENILTEMMVRIEDAMAIKRSMFHYFIAVAQRCMEQRKLNRKIALTDRLLYGLGWLFVYRPLKDRFGLSRLKVCYTAGEAIGADIFSFYRSLGINLKQLYGQTEASVYLAMHNDAEVDVNTVGPAAPGVQLRIAPDSEIQYRGPGTFHGYYNDPQKTAATFTEDGWARTGDAGYFDERGHLHVIDRLKDVGYLADGYLFAPKYVENKLKFSSHIREAVVFGNEKEYCTAIINIDLLAVGNWAERHGIVYGSYQELAGQSAVYDMVAGHIEQINHSLSNDLNMSRCQIRRFLILHKELDADDGELTRTQKVRRDFIGTRYSSLIDGLYSGPGIYDVSTELIFEDGRKGVLTGRVEIRDCTVYSADENKVVNIGVRENPPGPNVNPLRKII